jgi:dTDP-4-amino-4,6-dideoxygalactose transaminase
MSASLLQVALEAVTHPSFYPLALHPLLRAFDGLGIDLPTRLFEERQGTDPVAIRRRASRAIARIGSEQLARLPPDRERRRALARRLREALVARGVRHQEEGGSGDHPLFVTLFHPKRDVLRRTLLARGIDTQPTWMRAVRGDGEHAVDPTAERAEREGLYLPLYDGLDDERIGALLRALDAALSRARREAA